MTDVDIYIKEGEKERKDIVKKIYPSPFFDEPELKTVAITKDEAAIYKIVTKVYNRESYVQVSKRFTKVLKEIKDCGTLIELLTLIMDKIDYNTNKISLKSSDVDVLEVIKHSNNFSRYIDKLEEFEVLARTTKRGIYVVNHNMIFKGSYPTFISRYIVIYKDKIDKNIEGKVELRKGNL